ncbi:molybdopterin converting factor, large subunit [Denitrovibrio acetiphilus DSM 12809]|uniref:Molybdopterin synthase catalytic subunit n=1 Tax=Denitrovibrio acetiphilus (strain DSM 12809 / NBRC 114555 / N2460) TaxID=522772 RepID=D4H1X1_DENA2|nr:molybdenum cofactor biosynthesis protein MoaE [Denitrovibrio acetiphilus]ADD66948.1 molybdopterin converting factor, large subunit [Denitrovibrio acetiphilus DSM 12809]
MDISKKIAELKQDENFAQNVGMILVHNGVVRGTARADGSPVSKLEVQADYDKIDSIVKDIEALDGIYKVVVEARSGIMMPGDDLLFLIVAGDIRENVKPALALLLDRVKSEAVSKKEYLV